MAECKKCGTSIYNLTECPECGGTYCIKHADPENHFCYVCEVCGEEAELVCDNCGEVYCQDHIELENHGCESLESDFESDVPDHATSLKNMNTSNGDSAARSDNRKQATETAGTQETNNYRLLAGAIILVGGAILSITGIGMILGIPLMMLGFGIMFPRFTMLMSILAVIAFVLLLVSL